MFTLLEQFHDECKKMWLNQSKQTIVDKVNLSEDPLYNYLSADENLEDQEREIFFDAIFDELDNNLDKLHLVTPQSFENINGKGSYYVGTFDDKNFNIDVTPSFVYFTSAEYDAMLIIYSPIFVRKNLSYEIMTICFNSDSKEVHIGKGHDIINNTIFNFIQALWEEF